MYFEVRPTGSADGEKRDKKRQGFFFLTKAVGQWFVPVKMENIEVMMGLVGGAIVLRRKD